MTVVKSLSTLAKVYNVEDIGANDTIDELIDKIAGGIVLGSSNVTPASPAANKNYWGTTVSTMQTSVTVANGKITGTLHKLESGSLVDVWGEDISSLSSLQRITRRSPQLRSVCVPPFQAVWLSLTRTWTAFSRSPTRTLKSL